MARETTRAAAAAAPGVAPRRAKKALEAAETASSCFPRDALSASRQALERSPLRSENASGIETASLSISSPPPRSEAAAAAAGEEEEELELQAAFSASPLPAPSRVSARTRLSCCDVSAAPPFFSLSSLPTIARASLDSPAFPSGPTSLSSRACAEASAVAVAAAQEAESLSPAEASALLVFSFIRRTAAVCNAAYSRLPAAD